MKKNFKKIKRFFLFVSFFAIITFFTVLIYNFFSGIIQKQVINSKDFNIKKATQSQVTAYLKKKYPPGTHIQKIIKDMKAVGATVEKVKYMDSVTGYRMRYCLKKSNANAQYCLDAKYSNYIIRILSDDVGFFKKRLRGVDKRLIYILFKVLEGEDKIITYEEKVIKSRYSFYHLNPLFYSISFIDIYKKFHFKYYSPFGAKQALLVKHPVGSNVDDLIKTLEEGGAILTYYDKIGLEKIMRYKHYRKELVLKSELITIISVEPNTNLIKELNVLKKIK